MAAHHRIVAKGVADLVDARVGVESGDLRTWRFTRSESGNLVATTDPAGGITTFTYHSGGRLASVKDQRSKTTTYGSYHASGQPGTITDALGHSRTVTYDAFGRATSVVDRNGQTWSTTYDARGNVTSRSSPNGTATFGYDANDNQTSATPPGGATVTRHYDSRDLLAEARATIDGVLRKTTYGYYDDGHLKEVHEPREFAAPIATQKVTYERFDNNRVSAMVDEAGARTDLTYTPEGHIRTATEPTGTAGRAMTAYSYNRRGQVTSVTESGHFNPTTNAYSVHGELLQSKTPGGETTTFVYDKLGRLLRTVNAQGRHSTRSYDAAGNLVTLTQPEGHGGQLTTTYSYTARNEIASESDPADGGHIVEYAYDGEGRQRFRHDRHNGTIRRTVEQVYRADGALLSKLATGSGLSTHASTYGYDAAGNMTSATATLGGTDVSALTLGYNGAFEPTSWSETVYDTSGTARTKGGNYTYQPDGLLSSRTIDGQLTTYQHTVNGRETRVDPWGAPGTFDSEYYDNGLLRRATMPNGAVTEQLFDAADRLVSRVVHKPDQTMTTLSAWTGIAYDDDDQRSAETVTQAQVPGTTTEPVKAGNAEYAYDALGRLTSAKHPFEPDPVDYTLDDGGNVVKDADTVYTYAKNRLVRRASSTTEEFVEFEESVTTIENALYEYDHLGNRATESTTTTTTVTGPEDTFTFTDSLRAAYFYDGASHPHRVSFDDGSYVEYSYDGLGRLVRRVEHPVSGADVVTLFFHSGAGEQVVLETDGAGTAQARYVLDSQGNPLAQDRVGSRSYFVTDQRGNLTQQLDGSQDVVAVYGYDPYGEEKKALTKSSSAGWSPACASRWRPAIPLRAPTTSAPACSIRTSTVSWEWIPTWGRRTTWASPSTLSVEIATSMPVATPPV